MWPAAKPAAKRGATARKRAGVWTGNNDYGKPMARGADGVLTAAPIWNKIMTRALEGEPVEKFSGPKKESVDKPILAGKTEAEVPISVDAVTGNEIPNDCLSSWPPAFVSQQEVKEVHSILHYVNRSDPRGDAPEDPSKDPMYDRFEAPVRAWAKKQKFVTTRPKRESCDLRDPSQAPVVAFTTPLEGEGVSATSFSAAATATGAQSIASVVFMFDGREVSTVTAVPYVATIPLDGVQAGFHELKATATDAIGMTGVATVNVNVVASP